MCGNSDMRTLSAILLICAVNPLLAQSAESFDIASVKPSPAGTRTRIAIEPGGRFLAEGVSLKLLIASAWHIQAYQLAGGENWIASEPWTIEARAEGIGAVLSWTPPFFPESIAARVQSLVNDRFALKAHHETKELPVYRLSIGRNGVAFKVTPTPERQPEASRVPRPEDVVPAPGRAMAGPSGLAATAIPVQQLVILLGRFMDRPVIDKNRADRIRRRST